MDNSKILSFVSHQWDQSITPTLLEYCRIPNQSPDYDPEWAKNGLLLKAAHLLADWVKKQNVPGAKIELLDIKDRTPLILVEVEGHGAPKNDTILLYGHLDKQPPLLPWSEGLGPYTPVIRDDKLYARGAADDGYAIFSAMSAIQAIKAQGLPHARCVVLIEAGEESGSPDLEFYVNHLKDRIGVPSLIVCLDSGCGNYDQFWLTTSLRGVVGGVLEVKILEQGVHSGAASGVVPSTFRIIRMLLARLEEENTGRVLVPELFGNISESRMKQVKAAAQVLGNTIYSEFPFVAGAKPMNNDPVELFLNKTWRPTISYTGATGFPVPAHAGNVLRASTTMKLSIRLPPNVKVEPAVKAVKQLLEKDPPYGAHVTYTPDAGGEGWESPELAPWLEHAVHQASQAFWQQPACFMGEGGSIPFMGMLGRMFPRAQFVITGVLGPKSNAHGPNEMLVLSMGKRVTAAVAFVLAEHAKQQHA